MSRTVLILIASLSILASNSISAKVYKWVDENGKVHYSDKPFNKGEKELNIKSNISPEKAAKAKAAAQRRLEKLQRQVQSALAEQENTAKSNKKTAEEKEKIDRVCALIDQQLGVLNQQIRVVETDKKGEIKFLSDEERASQISKLTELKSKNCSE